MQPTFQSLRPRGGDPGFDVVPRSLADGDHDDDRCDADDDAERRQGGPHGIVDDRNDGGAQALVLQGEQPERRDAPGQVRRGAAEALGVHHATVIRHVDGNDPFVGGPDDGIPPDPADPPEATDTAITISLS